MEFIFEIFNMGLMGFYNKLGIEVKICLLKTKKIREIRVNGNLK